MNRDTEQRQNVTTGRNSNSAGTQPAHHLPAAPDRPADTDIASSAANTLQWTDGLPSGSVTVVIHDGWVTASGVVDWQYQRNAAIRALQQLAGVAGVIDRIVVSSNHFTIAIRSRATKLL